MKRTVPLLVQVLRDPAACVALSQAAWQDLVWQARSTELMAQLFLALEGAGLSDQVPQGAQRHLALAFKVAGRHQRAVEAELRAIANALAPLELPVLLLKGAAYAAQNLSASKGRIYNDIDLLVPKSNIDEVETRLSHAGWIGQNLNKYDQRYYRQWMHEIPPMEHKHRGTVIDVHHTLVPPTSGVRPDPILLLDASQAAPAPWLGYRVLAPTDQVLHSAVHLFFGEFHKGLRDLFDLHCLLTEFGARSGFWSDLSVRATLLSLEIPMADALLHCQRLWGTEVPRALITELQARRSSRWPGRARNWLFEEVLRPPHPSANGSGLASWLAFVRSHWLRMPLPLLAYHLGHKALFPEG